MTGPLSRLWRGAGQVVVDAAQGETRVAEEAAVRGAGQAVHHSPTGRVLTEVERAAAAGEARGLAPAAHAGELWQRVPARASVRLNGSKVTEGAVDELRAVGTAYRLKDPEVDELVTRARLGLAGPADLEAEIQLRASYRALTPAQLNGRPALSETQLQPLTRAGERAGLAREELGELKDRVALGLLSEERALWEIGQRQLARAPRPLPLERPSGELVASNDALLLNFNQTASALNLDFDTYRACQQAIQRAGEDPVALTQLKDELWDFMLYGQHARTLPPERAEAVVEQAALDAGFSVDSAVAYAKDVGARPEQLDSTLTLLYQRRLGRVADVAAGRKLEAELAARPEAGLGRQPGPLTPEEGFSIALQRGRGAGLSDEQSLALAMSYYRNPPASFEPIADGVRSFSRNSWEGSPQAVAERAADREGRYAARVEREAAEAAAKAQQAELAAQAARNERMQVEGLELETAARLSGVPPTEFAALAKAHQDGASGASLVQRAYARGAQLDRQPMGSKEAQRHVALRQFDARHFGAPRERLISLHEYGETFRSIGTPAPTTLTREETQQFNDALARCLYAFRHTPPEMLDQSLRLWESSMRPTLDQARQYAREGNEAGARILGLNCAATYRAMQIAAQELRAL